MKRILVTGWIDPDDIPGLADLDHPTGLTEEAYLDQQQEVLDAMQDVEFELQEVED